MRPILSIIIPVYNAEKYLERCLVSIEAQGFKDNELEVICVNDGSTDGSGEWLDAYAVDHSVVSVIHKANGGISSARNCGMDAMTGQYFEFVDADDELVPGSIADIIAAMKTENCAVAQFEYTRGGYNDCIDFQYSVAPMTLTGSIWRYIFSTEKLGHIRFDEALHYAEDTFFAQTVALNNPKCMHTDRVCYVYKENPNSVMAKRDFLESADSMLRLAENHKEYLKNDAFPESKRRIEIWCARATSGYLYYSLRGGRSNYPFQMLKDKGLWPYKKEWNLLRIRLGSKEKLKLTISGWCLFFVGFRPMWRLFRKTGLLRKMSQ